MRKQRTLLPPFHPIPHANAAVPEFPLRGFQLAEGRGQVLQFLAELALDGGQLGSGQGGEVDWLGVVVS